MSPEDPRTTTFISQKPPEIAGLDDGDVWVDSSDNYRTYRLKDKKWYPLVPFKRTALCTLFLWLTRSLLSAAAFCTKAATVLGRRAAR